MLQKTFRIRNAENLHESHEYRPIYSNLSWVGRVETDVFSLVPAGTTAGANTYTLCFINRTVNRGVGTAFTPAEIVTHQARLVTAFFLNAFTATNPGEVIGNCREWLPFEWDTDPSRLVPRVFDKEIRSTAEETDRFAKRVAQLVRLERGRYTAVLRFLEAYDQALRLVVTQPDAAYAMLVFGLEALAQDLDGFETAWEDYPQRERSRLDVLLGDVPAETADAIREVLVSSTHLKTTARFREFVISHTPDEFFLHGQTPRTPLRRSELRPAVEGAYHLRSRFAHQLNSAGYAALHASSRSEIFEVEGARCLTLAGLFRLARTVVDHLVEHSQAAEDDRVDWDRENRHGVLVMRPSPDYWFNNVNGLTAETAKRWFEGLLAIMDARFFGPPPKPQFVGISEGLAKFDWLPHPQQYALRAVAERCVSLLPTAPKREKLTLSALAALCLALLRLGDDDLSELDKGLSERGVVDPYSMEDMVVRVLCDVPFEDEPSFHARALERHLKRPKVAVPVRMELAAMIAMAQAFNADGEDENADRWLRHARDDAGSRPIVQDAIAGSLAVGYIPAASVALNDAFAQDLRQEQLLAERLRGFANGFMGYGNPSTEWWFIGMEEGGGSTLEEVTNRLSSWESLERARFVDIQAFGADPHLVEGHQRHFPPGGPMQRTWSQLIRIKLAASGEDHGAESVRRVQAGTFARDDGTECLAELLPLPSPSIAKFNYSEWFPRIPWLVSRERYEQELRADRILGLRKLLAEERPSFVVCYGLKYREIWMELLGLARDGVREIEAAGHRAYLATRDDQHLALIAHPAARGVPNRYFAEIGELLGAAHGG